MDEVAFDKAFSEYLNDDSFIKANDCIYDLARAAFVAGWKAAISSVQAESEK
ncbi:MAG: hypothetical protein K2O11_11320 [Oscillospiraceae bacterium]|nr:hypothetical protein [Clostridiales bacterium]MDE7172443.1 hypothetical protein [Oscillospiraceae bacterium]